MEKESPDRGPDMEHFWAFARINLIPLSEELVYQFRAMLNANMFSVYDEDQRTCIGEGLYLRSGVQVHIVALNSGLSRFGGGRRDGEDGINIHVF